MMRLGQWLYLRLGQAIDRDYAYGAQCVDLCNDWAVNGLGLPAFSGNALAIAGQAQNGWRWVPNRPSNAPPPGAIVVWRAYAAAAHTGPFGHCAVAVYGDASGLVTADQNWGGVHTAQLVHHRYDGVAGWQEPDPPRG